MRNTTNDRDRFMKSLLTLRVTPDKLLQPETRSISSCDEVHHELFEGDGHRRELQRGNSSGICARPFSPNRRSVASESVLQRVVAGLPTEPRRPTEVLP